MKTNVLLVWLSLLTVALVALWHRGEEPELAVMMARQQLLSHKLALAIQSEDRNLMEFYQHELEESTLEIIADVPEYDGYPISEMIDAMFLPELLTLKALLPDAPIPDIRAQYSILIASCNSCHDASAHGFIRITDGIDINPFNQRF
jgi:hypothetical protein